MRRLHRHHLLPGEVTVAAAQVTVQVVAATRAVDADTVLTSLVPLLSLLGTRAKVFAVMFVFTFARFCHLIVS